MMKFQAKYDVILNPTMAIPPVLHGEIAMSGTSPRVLERLLKYIPFKEMATQC